MSPGAHAMVLQFELYVPQSRSLKAKRAAIRPIVDGVRHRFRVSVAEVGHTDTWQRSAVAVALVSGSFHRLQELASDVERFVATAPDVELLDVKRSYLDTETTDNSHSSDYTGDDGDF